MRDPGKKAVLEIHFPGCEDAYIVDNGQHELCYMTHERDKY